mmetsp:Transcript_55894/g.121607  ORF Transcript_55894/g.121607 Transcript_55894/m.121607 type:complete len:213 (+) Transcript_55894:1015-1653(+)
MFMTTNVLSLSSAPTPTLSSSTLWSAAAVISSKNRPCLKENGASTPSPFSSDPTAPNSLRVLTSPIALGSPISTLPSRAIPATTTTPGVTHGVARSLSTPSGRCSSWLQRMGSTSFECPQYSLMPQQQMHQHSTHCHQKLRPQHCLTSTHRHQTLPSSTARLQIPRSTSTRRPPKPFRLPLACPPWSPWSLYSGQYWPGAWSVEFPVSLMMQ